MIKKIFSLLLVLFMFNILGCIERPEEPELFKPNIVDDWQDLRSNFVYTFHDDRTVTRSPHGFGRVVKWSTLVEEYNKGQPVCFIRWQTENDQTLGLYIPDFSQKADTVYLHGVYGSDLWLVRR